MVEERDARGVRASGGRALAILLGGALCLASPSSADSPDDSSELRRLIEEQRRLLEAQGAEVARLREEIAELRRKLESGSTAVPAPAPTPAATAAPATAAAKKGDDVSRLPEAEGKTVEVDDFPGALELPGTDARIRPGGWVRATWVDTHDPMGTNDRFAPSSIAVGEPTLDQTTGSVLTARPTRLNVDLRTPTGVGAMRAFVEADFEGSGATVRLRHAYGQWGRLLIGQTWSAFGDIKAEPDSIDREGFAASTHLRQAGVRFTLPLGARPSLALAIEAPDLTIAGAAEESELPDTILRFRFDQTEDPQRGYSLFHGGGHLQAAVVLRQLAAQAPDGTTVHAPGYGFGLTTRAGVPFLGRRDWFLSGLVVGKGVSRYIRDLEEEGGQDGVFDAATSELEALPAFSAYVALEHWWARTVRSTLAAGTVHVDNLDIQPPDALHRTDEISLNLAWSPIKRIDLIAELLWGRRTNKDGQRGEATQLQLGSTFRF